MNKCHKIFLLGNFLYKQTFLGIDYFNLYTVF